MSKKIKLNLDDLKVQSFVTSLSEAEKNKLMGGSNDDQRSHPKESEVQCTCYWVCGTYQCSAGSGTCC